MATMSNWEKVEKPQMKREDCAIFYDDMNGPREREFPMLLGRVA